MNIDKILKFFSLLFILGIFIMLLIIYNNNNNDILLKDNIENYKDSLKNERFKITLRDKVLVRLETKIHDLQNNVDSLKSLEPKIKIKYSKIEDEILSDTDSSTIDWFERAFPR